MKRERLYGIIKVDKIKEYMKDNKLSQKRFAEICKLNVWNLQHVLSGDCHFDCNYIINIAKAMNVKLSDLMNDF